MLRIDILETSFIQAVRWSDGCKGHIGFSVAEQEQVFTFASRHTSTGVFDSLYYVRPMYLLRLTRLLRFWANFTVLKTAVLPVDPEDCSMGPRKVGTFDFCMRVYPRAPIPSVVDFHHLQQIWRAMIRCSCQIDEEKVSTEWFILGSEIFLDALETHED